MFDQRFTFTHHPNEVTIPASLLHGDGLSPCTAEVRIDHFKTTGQVEMSPKSLITTPKPTVSMLQATSFVTPPKKPLTLLQDDVQSHSITPPQLGRPASPQSAKPAAPVVAKPLAPSPKTVSNVLPWRSKSQSIVGETNRSSFSYIPPDPHGSPKPNVNRISMSQHIRRKRWHVTIQPPELLPHSPPPDTIADFANGYGPSGRFGGGVVVPLQQSLSGQIAYIVKEFSLPSPAGICVYLCVDDGNSAKSNSCCKTGTSNTMNFKPRLTDEVWSSMFAEFLEDDLSASAVSTIGSLPIAARLEFDIDIRKAKWLDYWISGRRQSHPLSYVRNFSQPDTANSSEMSQPVQPVFEQQKNYVSVGVQTESIQVQVSTPLVAPHEFWKPDYLSPKVGKNYPEIVVYKEKATEWQSVNTEEPTEGQQYSDEDQLLLAIQSKKRKPPPLKLIYSANPMACLHSAPPRTDSPHMSLSSKVQRTPLSAALSSNTSRGSPLILTPPSSRTPSSAGLTPPLNRSPLTRTLQLNTVQQRQNAREQLSKPLTPSKLKNSVLSLAHKVQREIDIRRVSFVLPGVLSPVDEEDKNVPEDLSDMAESDEESDDQFTVESSQDSESDISSEPNDVPMMLNIPRPGNAPIFSPMFEIFDHEESNGGFQPPLSDDASEYSDNSGHIVTAGLILPAQFQDLSLPEEEEGDLDTSIDAFMQKKQQTVPPVSSVDPIVFSFPSLRGEEGIEAALAEYVLEAQCQSIDRRGRFCIAISGKDLPRVLASGLADDDRVEWSKWEVFLCHETLTERSFYSVLEEDFISKVPIPAWQVHPIIGPNFKASKDDLEELGKTAEELAQDYEAQIFGNLVRESEAAATGTESLTQLSPRFDLVLMSMSSAGAVCSLEPNAEIVDEEEWWVGHTVSGNNVSISFTIPLLCPARRVAIVAVGSDKAKPLENALDKTIGIRSSLKVPAGRIALDVNPVVWFVDEMASESLTYPVSEFWDGEE